VLRVFDESKFVKGDEYNSIVQYVRAKFAWLRDHYVKRFGLPGVIYHYTSQAGFKGIVESGVLRATHIAYMNDSSEYQHAVTLLGDAVKAKRAKIGDAPGCALLDCMGLQLGLLAPADIPGVFVACFSAAGDSLSQWRNYGSGESGLALGFDRGRLEGSIGGQNAALGPVLYDDGAKDALVSEFVEWALFEFRKRFAQQSGSAETYAEQWSETFFAHAAWMVAPLMKSAAFQEEREWRVLYGPKLRSEVHVVEKNLALTSFVELKLGSKAQFPQSWDEDDPGRRKRLPDHLPIVEIWFGPGRAQDLSNLSAKVLVENAGYPDPIQLIKSKVPFRNT
jgi:hypothetical protein